MDMRSLYNISGTVYLLFEKYTGLQYRFVINLVILSLNLFVWRNPSKDYKSPTSVHEFIPIMYSRPENIAGFRFQQLPFPMQCMDT
jgi:hypothetical protein